jgi:hypothetical protein
MGRAGKNTDIQATKIRCKKALASGSESCNIGFARCQYHSFRNPLRRVFFLRIFSRSSAFPSDLCRRDGAESTPHHGRVCPNKSPSSSTTMSCGALFQSCSLGTARPVPSVNRERPCVNRTGSANECGMHTHRANKSVDVRCHGFGEVQQDGAPAPILDGGPAREESAKLTGIDLLDER